MKTLRLRYDIAASPSQKKHMTSPSLEVQAIRAALADRGYVSLPKVERRRSRHLDLVFADIIAWIQTYLSVPHVS